MSWLENEKKMCKKFKGVIRVKKSLLNTLRSNKKKQINAYYLRVLYQGQSSFLRILNYFVYRFLVFLASFIFFFYFTQGQRLLAALWAALSVLIIYHYGTNYYYKKKFAQIIMDVNSNIGEEEFWRRIKAMDKEAFVLFTQEILSRLPGFYQIEITEHLENEGIDILCKYGEELVAVQCHLLDGDNTVESRAARELSRAMSRRKYSKGIIISTTDFREDTKRFCNLIKEKRQINLLGQKELLQMAKEAGKYPKEEEIRELIIKKLEHQSKIFKEAKEKLFIKPRLKPYFFYGTLLSVCGILFFEGIFGFLYLLGGSGLYLLGIIGFFFNINGFQREKKVNWEDKLI